MVKITRLFISVISIIVAVLVCELYLRATGYSNSRPEWLWATGFGFEKPIFIPDKNRIYALNKNIYVNDIYASDKYGFRLNLTHGDQLSSNIIVVGDSFTYSDRVKHEDAYPAQLESLLKQSGKDIVVHNAGVPGYGVDQEYVYIQDELLRQYTPRIIIWNINRNDLNDSDEACIYGRFGDDYVRFPGWANSVYIQGIFMRDKQAFKKMSSVFNMALWFPNIIYRKSRVTPGCTQLSGIKKELVVQKIVHLIKLLQNEVINTKTKLVVTIVPFQNYFSNTTSNSGAVDFHDYELLRQGFIQASIGFVDLSAEIAQRRNTSLLAVQTGQTLGRYTTNILGEKNERLDLTLFNADEEGMSYGNRHLNTEGNRETAQILFEKVIQLIP